MNQLLLIIIALIFLYLILHFVINVSKVIILITLTILIISILFFGFTEIKDFSRTNQSTSKSNTSLETINITLANETVILNISSNYSDPV